MRSVLQVLTIPPSGSLRDHCIGLCKNSKNKHKRKLSGDFASIKSLPKRLLPAVMVADVSFELITTFAAMCVNVDRLGFFPSDLKI